MASGSKPTSSSPARTLRNRQRIDYTEKKKKTDPSTNQNSDNLYPILKTPKAATQNKLKMVIRKSAVRRGREVFQASMDVQESGRPVGVQSVEPLKTREKEFETINSWIDSSLAKIDPLTIYISGSPGTGKTATLRLILQKWEKRVFSSVINCVSIKTQSDLIKAIFLTLQNTKRPTIRNLENLIVGLAKPLILVLDEIDHLCNTSNSLLYAAFKWPQQLSSKLVIIGIANSIDLTERLLPKLKLSTPPKTLVFSPYTKDDIKEILEEKFTKEKINTSMDNKAIELCARKVAAMSGDLRTALHVFKATNHENETSANCREVLGVLNTVYSSPLARARLPLQPRLILAVCLCMSATKKTNLTTDNIFSGYVESCKVIQVPPLESDDLLAAFQTLESQSFISTSANGQIRLQVDSKTARNVISNNAMVDQIAMLNL